MSKKSLQERLIEEKAEIKRLKAQNRYDKAMYDSYANLLNASRFRPSSPAPKKPRSLRKAFTKIFELFKDLLGFSDVIKHV